MTVRKVSTASPVAAHLGDGMLHHGTAGFAVGRLEGLLLEPAPEGDVSKTTLRRGLDNRGTGD